MLLVIYYKNKEGIQKELRINKEIAPNWSNLATALKFSNTERAIILKKNFHVPDDCTDNMLTDWMAKEVNHTWRKLIQAMRNAWLHAPAENLAKALRNKVN